MTASTDGRGPKRESCRSSSVRESAPGAAFSYSASSRINETITGTSAGAAARMFSSAAIALVRALDLLLLLHFVLFRFERGLGFGGVLRFGLHRNDHPARQDQRQRYSTNFHTLFIVCRIGTKAQPGDG